MPMMGLGTFQLNKATPENLENLLDRAIALEYRLFDLAEVYKISDLFCETLAKVLNKHNLSRSDVFLTSKIQPKDQGLDKAEKACLKILSDTDKFGLAEKNYVDLVLIHWPGTQKVKPDNPKNKTNRLKTWSVLEKFYQENKFLNIGVSNYTTAHLQELAEGRNEDKICQPAVIQNEHHLFYEDTACVEYCRQHGIVYQGYSPFGQSKIIPALAELKTENETLKKLLESHPKLSTHQILLLYCLQNDVCVIPKTENPDRLESNFLIPDFLSEDELEFLKKLKFEYPNYAGKTAWDPTKIL